MAVVMSSLQIVPMLDAQFKVAELEEAVRDVEMQSVQSTPYALFPVFEHRPHDSPMRTEHSVTNCVLVKLQQWRCAHLVAIYPHTTRPHDAKSTPGTAWGARATAAKPVGSIPCSPV